MKVKYEFHLSFSFIIYHHIFEKSYVRFALVLFMNILPLWILMGIDNTKV